MTTNKAFFIFFYLFAIPTILLSQRGQQNKSQISGKQWNVSALISYDSDAPGYTWDWEFSGLARDFDLDFITPVSGEFEVETDTVLVSIFREVILPKNKVSLGFSLQTINSDQLYHDLQIPTLSFSEFSINSTRRSESITNPNETAVVISEAKSSAFNFAIKYEIGKYLRSIKSDKLRFGFGFNLGTNYYYFKTSDEVYSAIESPLAIPRSGHIFDVNFGVGLSSWLQLTREFSLELRYAPYLRLVSLGSLTDPNPSIQLNLMEGSRTGQSPAFGGTLQVGLKFRIREFIYEGKGRSKRR